MKVLLSVCLLLCLALSVNSVRVRTHAKSHATQSGWQAYIDQNLIGSGLAGAAIIGANDGGVWAISRGLTLKGGEGATIVNNFKSPSKFTAQGVIVNGVKYFTLKADNYSVYGKGGAGGVVLVKTAKTIIIGVYDSKLQPGAAARVVEGLGEYLIDQGY